MAKTLTAEPVVSPQGETKQQRKKLAKQEAKIMLKIEQTQKDVQKASQKLAKAQTRLDEKQAHLHALEARLQQLRTPKTSFPPEITEALLPKEFQPVSAISSEDTDALIMTPQDAPAAEEAPITLPPSEVQETTETTTDDPSTIKEPTSEENTFTVDPYAHSETASNNQKEEQ